MSSVKRWMEKGRGPAEFMEYIGKNILVVDDERAIRESISDYLEDIGCSSDMASNGIEALERIEKKSYDALIVDLNMPGLDGFGVLEKIVPLYPEMPVIVLSGVGILDKAVDAIRRGAWDFLSKPIGSFSVLQLTLNRALERSRLIKENRLYKEHLEEEVVKKTEQVLEMSRSIIMTQKEMILRLSDVVETRSHETGNHVLRVSEYSNLMATILGMSDEQVGNLKLASPMHDVGKIGISDLILNKPGKLTIEEFRLIQNHTVIGYNIFYKSSLPVLQLAAEIALNHHENWNGGGYPNRKSGKEIPLAARITTIVDVFDAISHSRVYKEAWDIDRTYSHIKENSGVIFDPELTEIFLANFDGILDIYNGLV